MSANKEFRYSYTSPHRNISAAELNAGETRSNLRPVICAVILGAISCLVFGVGLTCVLVWDKMLLGLILGVVGIVGMVVGPAFYHWLLGRYKNRLPH